MPDRVLQNHYCVVALQHRLAYNGVMSISSREQSNQPVASARRAGPRLARARSCRAGLAAVTLLGAGVLAAACAVPSVNAVVGLSGHGVPHHALAFVNRMRTHGEPKLPDPVVHGNSVHISITPGSGVDPRSARFTAAFKACKYLTSPGKGSGAVRGVSTGG
jgi:hypothetical protein